MSDAPDDRAAGAPKIAAVGAGRMGRGIATAFACAGRRVALVDLRARDDAAWDALRDEALAEVRAGAQTLAELGALPPDQVDALAQRVRMVRAPDAADAIAAAELVFEAVPETIDAKRDAFAAIDRCAGTGAIVASTTSSMLVTELAALLRAPERFLNAHWLNPAYLIPVVELSVHPGTAPPVVERMREWLARIGKLPVVCGPAPGYIVPRLQALVMNEAARMVEQGIATAQEIDKATRFGLGLRFAALGVVEFIDFGGIDILHHASREMARSIDSARYAAPPIVARMIEQGDLGLKTASGFYDYAGRDLAAYRHDALARVFAQLRSAGMWQAPASDTIE